MERVSSTDQPSLQEQIHNVRLAMLAAFNQGEGVYSPPIYDPNLLEEFCKTHGAPTLFQSLIKMMTPLRHHRRKANSGKSEETRKHAVTMVYMLSYTQSQRCNWLQQDVANFLNYHGLSDSGMRALHEMGMCVGMYKFYRGVHDSSKHHFVRIKNVVDKALENQQAIVIIIDDYTNIHTRRRCDTSQQRNNSHMATILLRVFDIPAVRIQEVPANMPGGINVHLLMNELDRNMASLFSTFATTAPQQIMHQFFDPHMERLRLTTYMYGEHNDVRQIRGVQNAYLIDCVPQPLKSYTNYLEAAQIYLATPLQQYLQQFNVIIPGDWPSQFYQRQLSYNLEEQSPLRNTIATMGPLHVSLNGQENVVLKFITFFKAFYRHLFQKQLANKPKPWRITLMLELLYGGWTLIRQPVLTRLQRFKDVQFVTLLNLVDNYVPLTLSIYSVYFKADAFDQYFLAMQQVWVMYYTFQRKHYDKAPLVWLSNVAYWKYTGHPLYTLVKNNLHLTDEYPIENFHSLLRARTNEWDTPAAIQRKARLIDANKHNLQHFSTYFVPPKRAMLNHNQLRRLKVKCAKYLLSIVDDICHNPFAAQEQPRLPRQRKRVSRWVLPHLFGQVPVKNVLLPLGYQWYGNSATERRLQPKGQTGPFHPDQRQSCDRTGCHNAHSPIIFFSCGHSFHATCVAPVLDRCFICEQGLLGALTEKATIARNAIFHPDANTDQDDQNDSDSSDDDGDVDEDEMNADEHQTMTAAEAAAEIQNLSQLIANLPPVQLL